jgi:hypothetical protein
VLCPNPSKSFDPVTMKTKSENQIEARVKEWQKQRKKFQST